MHAVNFVRQLFSESQSKSVVRFRAFGPAGEPIHQRTLDMTTDARVVPAILECMVAMGGPVIECDTFFAVLDGWRYFTRDGIVIPSAFAVLRLIIRLNLVGWGNSRSRFGSARVRFLAKWRHSFRRQFCLHAALSGR